VLQRPHEFTQFTSWAFTRRDKESGLVPSMSSVVAFDLIIADECHRGPLTSPFHLWG
jgi:superfamily II DNA or RNA helicase